MSKFNSWQVLKSGGNLNNGTQAGVTYLNANNSSGNLNSNISTQLTEYVKNILFVIYTTALAENKSSIKVLVPFGKALGVT
jgi:hypothetical protein